MKNETAILNKEFDKKRLTPRQKEVAFLLIKGITSAQMGKKLDIEEKSIKFHLTGIYKKLGVDSRIKVIHHCYRSIIKQMRF